MDFNPDYVNIRIGMRRLFKGPETYSLEEFAICMVTVWKVEHGLKMEMN